MALCGKHAVSVEQGILGKKVIYALSVSKSLAIGFPSCNFAEWKVALARGMMAD